MVHMRTIDAQDVNLFLLTDDPQEAVDYLKETAIKQFGLTYGPKARPRKIFAE